MAKTKTATAKQKTVGKDEIIANYMEFVLENGERPASVYKFCKDNAYEEGQFYMHFGSFEGIREQIWVSFYENAIAVIEKDPHYSGYGNQEKMLTFFFTFFEILTANRSYVLLTLNESPLKIQELAQLRQLRIKVREFASQLIEKRNEEKTSRFSKNPISVFSEGAWLQFLFLLKYWHDDQSAGFEKTDMAIEKSVKAIFDVFETTPLESVLDFGKFLFNSNFKK